VFSEARRPAAILGDHVISACREEKDAWEIFLGGVWISGERGEV